MIDWLGVCVSKSADLEGFEINWGSGWIVITYPVRGKRATWLCKDVIYHRYDLYSYLV